MADDWQIRQIHGADFGADLAAVAKRLIPPDRAALRKAMVAPVQDMQREAKGRVSVRPGGGTYKRMPGAIRAGAAPTKASVWIGYPNPGRYPTALGAEYGARRAWVYGRVTTQGKLRRRQFPVWRGNQWQVMGSSGVGWILLPVIRRRFPAMQKAVIEAVDDAFNALTKP